MSVTENTRSISAVLSEAAAQGKQERAAMVSPAKEMMKSLWQKGKDAMKVATSIAKKVDTAIIVGHQYAAKPEVRNVVNEIAVMNAREFKRQTDARLEGAADRAFTRAADAVDNAVIRPARELVRETRAEGQKAYLDIAREARGVQIHVDRFMTNQAMKSEADAHKNKAMLAEVRGRTAEAGRGLFQRMANVLLTAAQRCGDYSLDQSASARLRKAQSEATRELLTERQTRFAAERASQPSA
jgi:hypothetical protein